MEVLELACAKYYSTFDSLHDLFKSFVETAQITNELRALIVAWNEAGHTFNDIADFIDQAKEAEEAKEADQ